MAISVKHTTQAVGTNAGNGEIGKDQWNEDHTLILDPNKLVGRSSSGTGAAEEISVGAGLALSGGELTATGTPSGIDGEVQFNSSGSFGSDPAFAYTANTVGGVLSVGSVSIGNDSARGQPTIDFGGLSNLTGYQLYLVNGSDATLIQPYRIILKNTSGGIDIRSAANAAYNLVLPSTAGTANQLLSTDGSGNLSWTSVVGVTDGDKGDVTVSSSGSSWTIDNGAVNLATKVSGTLPIANGGTGKTTGVEAVANLGGFETTVTANTTTTLTSASHHRQQFTGTSSQTLVLPDVTTLQLGWTYYILNTSTGFINVQSSGGNAVASVTGNSAAFVTCVAVTGTTDTSWHYQHAGSRYRTGTGNSVFATSPTLNGSPTISTGTITTSGPFTFTQTWNASAVTFTGFQMNVTDTASATGSLLMDLQVGGTRQFGVTKAGVLLGRSGGNQSLEMNATNGVLLTVNNTSPNAVSVNLLSTTGDLIASNGGKVRWSDTGLSVFQNGWLGFSSTSNGTGASDVILSRKAAANLRFGAADAAAPVAQTLSVQSVVAGTTNTAGANLTIDGSQGTGTGAGGSVIIRTAPAGTTGTAQNALVERVRIGPNGEIGLGGANYGTTGQVIKSNGSGAAPSWQTAAGTWTSLGTIATTSGASVALTGLTLTNYSTLVLMWNGVSASGTGSLQISDGSQTYVVYTGSNLSTDVFNGATFIDLRSGSLIGYGDFNAANTYSVANANTAGAGAKLAIGRTRYSTASTSVTVLVNAGTLDAGSVTVYGIS